MTLPHRRSAIVAALALAGLALLALALLALVLPVLVLPGIMPGGPDDGGSDGGAGDPFGPRPLLPPLPAANGPLYPEALASAPSIGAAAAILIDYHTGAVLFDQRMHTRRHPASTTKVMTAVLVLEYGTAHDVVTVSRRAASTPGSSMGLRAGDAYRVESLLYGLLLPSGNDAAVALAEYISGSELEFAGLMTEKARMLGLENSRFRNSHGLTRAGHYASAYDLAMLTRYALGIPAFREIVCRRVMTVCNEKGDPLTLQNTNRLLWYYDFAEGVKTGTTSAAGRSLIASASREGQRLIAVVLGSPSRWREAEALLEWGFETFRAVRLAPAGGVVARLPVGGGLDIDVPVAAGRELRAVVPRSLLPGAGAGPGAAAGAGSLDETGSRTGGSPGGVAWTLETFAPLRAPLPRGQAVGAISLLVEGRPVAGVPAVTARSVPSFTLTGALIRLLSPLLNRLAPRLTRKEEGRGVATGRPPRLPRWGERSCFDT